MFIMHIEMKFLYLKFHQACSQPALWLYSVSWKDGELGFKEGGEVTRGRSFEDQRPRRICRCCQKLWRQVLVWVVGCRQCRHLVDFILFCWCFMRFTVTVGKSSITPP